MATINLGNIKFNWKGTYNAGTTYAIDDVVAYNGSSYVCIQATTGNLPTVTAYWDTMSSAGTNGTNGTDLTTTLTTQGDIVYRDASGLARLPAGSVNQVLQSGGSGANPSWGTVSSDFVKLVSGTHSGTELTLDNLFTADYPLYKVYLYNVIIPNSWIGMRTRTGGSSGNTIGANEYRFKSYMTYKTASASSDTAENGWNAGEFRIGWTSQSNAEKPQQFEITIPEPMSTSTKFSYGMLNTFVNDTYVGHAHGGGTLDRTASEVYTGLVFHQDGGNSWTGKYVVYGLKI